MNILRKKTINLLVILSLLICMLASGCSSDKDKKVSKSGFYFDTIITITLYGTDDETYIDKCFEMASNYENKFSTTIDTSEISKINDNAGKKYIKVSDDTIDILKAGISYCKNSQNKFDITLGKLSELWNISDIAKECEDDSNTVDASYLPSESEINKLKDNIDYTKILIDGNKVMLKDDTCKIDLGAIAKGYIADRMKEYLNSNNITSGIINLGGNVLTIGKKADGSNYKVGIQKPFDQSGQALLSVEVSDKSVVTSGIYERYYKVDNKIYHHILNLETGYPCENDIYSVTIISDKSVDGDALSTICFLLGADEGMKYIETLDDIEAIYIKNDYSVVASSGIENDISYIE